MSDNIGWESCIKVDGVVKPSSMQANKLAVKFIQIQINNRMRKQYTSIRHVEMRRR